MSPLTIRADELIMAFENHSPGAKWHLDLQSGEVFPTFEDNAEEEDTKLLEADPERFLEINPVPSWVGFDIMWDFVETVPEGEIKEKLEKALSRKRPFRLFKDVVWNYPDIEARWFKFHEQAFIAIIREWLAEQGLEITIVPFHASQDSDGNG